MIERLRVRNLATIEELELALGEGMTVVTGETGAGKSVLLGALALLAGQRVGAELVRAGAGEAAVEATLRGRELVARAHALGLGSADADEVLIARTIAREGRGRVHVNGRLATVALLAELVGDALEITSQGEHQSLLRPETQARLLDEFAEQGALAAEVAHLHERYRATASASAARRRDRAELARREDQLRFEVEQIERIAPVLGELEALDTELRRLGHVERLVQASERALSALDGDDGARALTARVRAELRAVESLDPALAEPSEALARAALELDEATRVLERYATRLEADPARLAEVEARLGELRRLQTRYGASIEAILAHAAGAQRELDELGGGEERTSELERERVALGTELESRARALSAARAEAGRALEHALAKELEAVELGRARFSVAFEPLPVKDADGFAPPSGPSGRERASFRLVANPGEEPRRLREAASGGELARLLLALRNVLRDASAGATLLFDEVDAGLGGATARRVGERLRALATRQQVICITHLPQIAAFGDTHLRVVKRVRAGRTRTHVVVLEGETRIDEIARLSAGATSEAARAHARALLAAV